MTDKKFPLCSRLGVLRKSSYGSGVVVSSAALHKKLGWERYRKFLPYMQNYNYAGIDAATVEAWLKTHAHPERAATAVEPQRKAK